ncbi:DUF6304 family protein [Neolewinella persica]|uniref:DUF6304 family protein n=1 Tax=Neolewinella persica TaxID=70998 RepID=UPI00036BFA12|nr:DUF6304 family protein [Neolewinella persica]
MKQPIIYRGKAGTINGTLVNRFVPECEVQPYPLLITLDGLDFEGNTFTGLSPVTEHDAAKALGKFEFVEYGNQHPSTAYVELMNYQLEFDLRILIVDKNKAQDLEVDGTCTVDKGIEADLIKFEFTLYGDGHEVSNCDFDGLFDFLKEKIGPEYCLKNCHGCAYSDYSPYGNDTFGTMMCFRNCKSEYSKVKSKADFFEVLNLNQDITVQETYLCDQFEARKKGTGYRG